MTTDLTLTLCLLIVGEFNKPIDYQAMKQVDLMLALPIWIYPALAVDVAKNNTALLSLEQHPGLRADVLHNQHEHVLINADYEENRQLYDSQARKFLNLFLKNSPEDNEEKKVSSPINLDLHSILFGRLVTSAQTPCGRSLERQKRLIRR